MKDDNFEENLKRILDEQNKLFDSLKDIIPILEQVENNLRKVNEMTGATARYNNIKDEILLKGWETCKKLYNPESNKNDPAAVPLFEFYKYVYEDMKRKGEI